MNKKRTRMHKRIFFAFSAVFFVSYLLVTVVFDTFIRSDEPFIQTSEYRQSFAEYHGIELDPDNRLFAVRLLGIPLFAFVGVLFVVSLVVTYFLSDSITRPIERLGKFATSIGPNNLEPKDFSFKDQELADLNTALNQTVTQLAVYDSEQKAFFQNASHELRTPLMSIQSYAEGIIYDVMQPKDAAETILQETHRMAELVKDLLYIAQLGNITAVYKKEPVDIMEILQKSADHHQTIADKKGITLTLKTGVTPPPYLATPDLLKRAVDNLISNAVRHAATTVTLSCHYTDSRVKIQVADDGAGINLEILPHIFERFFKGEGGNTGIGLSIVKSIAEQHGGTVTAKNVENGGAIFTIALPLPLLYPSDGGK